MKVLVINSGSSLVKYELLDMEKEKIGGAHVCAPVTGGNLVCRLLLEKN